VGHIGQAFEHVKEPVGFGDLDLNPAILSLGCHGAEEE